MRLYGLPISARITPWATQCMRCGASRPASAPPQEWGGEYSAACGNRENGMKISIPVTKERIANTITASYGGGGGDLHRESMRIVTPTTADGCSVTITARGGRVQQPRSCRSRTTRRAAWSILRERMRIVFNTRGGCRNA